MSFGTTPIPWTPRAYQKEGVRRMIANAAQALLLDPGLGKTTITLAAHKVLKRQRLVSKTLVVAPLRPVYRVWPDEAAKWRDFSVLRVSILHGSRKRAALDVEADVYVINPEGMEWLVDQLGYERDPKGRWKKRRRAPAWPFEMLVVDESSMYKHTQTQRFKLMRAILGEFRRRYVLTGSPVPNGLLDLFGQVYILDCGASLGRYISHYRRRFFYPSGFGGFDWKLVEGGERKIFEAIAPLAYRVDATDAGIDLPELVVTDVVVDLPPEARAIYDALENDFLADVESGRVRAVNAAVASGKCRQVANGGVYDEHGKAHHLHREKIDAVVELVEELSGKPAMIAYDTHHDRERLSRAFPEAPWVGGGVSAKTAARAIDAWNAGELPVLLVHPTSTKFGLNLQESGNVLIFHSIPWDLEAWDQLIRRLLRQGQRAKRVLVYRIVARDTLDDRAIIPALERKDRTQRGLFAVIKELQRIRFGGRDGKGNGHGARTGTT